MTDPVARLIHAELADSRRVLETAMADAGFVAALGAIGRAIAQALAAGGKVMLAGNGGSAADAQHIAGELLSRLNFDRAPLAAVALTTDSSVLTAVGNDYGYAHVFERQVRGLGRKGDVFVGISTSGRSQNILAAFAAARALGIVTVGFGGEGGGDMAPLCDHLLAVPSRRTPMIQQIHIVAAHIVCGIVENSLFGGPKT
jgi:D-sedoheptulose 7-phosphate isomerase